MHLFCNGNIMVMNRQPVAWHYIYRVSAMTSTKVNSGDPRGDVSGWKKLKTRQCND